MEPEAYREGWVPFLGLTIWLDSRPLIPRPETEWWAEELVTALAPGAFVAEKSSGLLPSVGQTISSQTPLSPDAPLKILDLCAGSGAIGCAILKHCPNTRVYFGEIDPAHETTILKNIRENNLDEARANVRIGNLFSPFTDMQFAVIAANPPYIPESRVLDASVRDFEPALALRAGADGLAVIQRIANRLSRHLAPGGNAWIECDSLHATAARELFTEQGFTAEIHNDQYERPRLIVVSYP